MIASDEKRAWLCTSALVTLVTLIPFLPGLLSGHCFFFRDLARQFFPLRLFAVEGLWRGEIRLWNPYLHEGVPLSLPALSYPLDLLQMLVPSEYGFSWLLALHVPLGALALLALARGLGLPPLAAAGGAIVYALGGFYLSTLNLYVYVQAAAWAPLVILGLLRAAEDRPRWRALAALAVAVGLSTTGAEIVAQAVAVAFVLLFARREPRRLLRAGAALALGVGLAAPTLALVRLALVDSARATGFPTDVVLAHSIDPWTLGQVLIGDWHGDLGDIANHWWGTRFFPTGFPYILSLYVGASALTLAAVGARHGRAPRGRLLLLACAALLIALGRFAGLRALVELLPLVHAFRFPAKAFFTVHLMTALLAALGLEVLLEGRGWRGAAAVAVALGGLLVSLGGLAGLFPRVTGWFLTGFLPPSFDWPRRAAIGEQIFADAARGGAFAVLLALLALLALGGRLRPERAALACVVLMAADLLRAGTGLNRTVTPAFYEPSQEMRPLVEQLRASGGRVFSCEPEMCSSYYFGRSVRPYTHDAWTFATLAETLTPASNMNAGVLSALSRDLTALVPRQRTLAPREPGPEVLRSDVEALRLAGVAHVLCLDPVDNPELALRASVTPPRIAPLSIQLYDLLRPLPLRAVASEVRPAAAALAPGEEASFSARGGVVVEADIAPLSGVTGSLRVLEDRPDRIAVTAQADRASVLVVRDAYAQGWKATVNGAAAPVWRADGRHRAIPIPAGRSDVVLRYRPPGLGAALAISVLSLVAITLSARRAADPGRRRS